MQVYLNAAGLLLRLYVRGELDICGDRLKLLAQCLTNQVSLYTTHMLYGIKEKVILYDT